MARQRRQDHRAERDAEDAEREFEQAVGLGEPGLRTGDQERRDQRVEQQVHLRDRGTEQGRHHQGQDPAHVGMAPAPTRQGEQVEPRQRWQLHQQLQDAGDEDRPAERHDRHVERMREP
jgi:hypothetical protein